MKRTFETIKLSAIAIGMAISVSCNTILASLFRYVEGPALYLSIGIAGLCMTVVVLCFTELSSKFPGAIGIRAFTKAAFGNRVSLASTLFYVCMIILMGALEIFLCHLLLQQLFPQTVGILLLCLLLCFVLIVNLNGYELSLRLQVLMTLLVVTMMVGLSTMALSGITTVQPTKSHMDFFQSVPGALFLFVGIEWAVMHVSRHESFKRTLPIALIISVMTIGILYSVFGAALNSYFPSSQLPSLQLPHLELARRLNASAAIWIVTVLSLLAMLTSFNVGLSGAARILYSLAREREIPAWFAGINSSNLVPKNAMLFITGSVLLMVPVMAVATISSYISLLLGFHLCLVYAMVLFAWWQMRRKSDKRGTRQPINNYFVWPVLVFLVAISLGVLAEINSMVIQLMLLAEGLTIFIICTYPFRSAIAKT